MTYFQHFLQARIKIAIDNIVVNIERFFKL